MKSGGECMNCFIGTSMMISEQWKAVCCRRECAEQNRVLFSSEVFTALTIRQILGTFAQSQKASVAFIMSVCPQVSVRFLPDGSTWNLFGSFHENLSRKIQNNITKLPFNFTSSINISNLLNSLSLYIFSISHLSPMSLYPHTLHYSLVYSIT
jgi:hypothetical protein